MHVYVDVVLICTSMCTWLVLLIFKSTTFAIAELHSGICHRCALGPGAVHEAWGEGVARTVRATAAAAVGPGGWINWCGNT